MVSVNTSAPRYRQTSRLLEEFGFEVEAVAPYHLGGTRAQQTLSNKIAFLDVLRLVSIGSDPWGYLFEDDVVIHELSSASLETLIAAETQANLFQYLGICATDVSVIRKKMCGRCAHAMGLSREGATELLHFAGATQPPLATGRVPREEDYFDVVVEGWCLAHAGFMVFGPLKDSIYGESGHWGTFVQDRKKFKSEIDQALH